MSRVLKLYQEETKLLKVVVGEITSTCVGRLLQRKSQMFELSILLLLDREEGNISQRETALLNIERT